MTETMGLSIVVVVGGGEKGRGRKRRVTIEILDISKLF